MAWCPYDTCIASFFSNLPPLPVNTTPPSARAAYHAVQPPSAHPPHCLQCPCLQRMPPPPPLPPPSRSAAAFRSCQLCVAEEATAGCRCCSATALSSCFYISQVKQRKYLVKKKEDSKQVICCGCCQPHAPCHSPRHRLLQLLDKVSVARNQWTTCSCSAQAFEWPQRPSLPSPHRIPVLIAHSKRRQGRVPALHQRGCAACSEGAGGALPRARPCSPTSIHLGGAQGAERHPAAAARHHRPHHPRRPPLAARAAAAPARAAFRRHTAC